MRGVCAVSSDEGPCARHASRALRRVCGQGAVLSLCMVRPGSGRFGVGFWVGFWVGLRARDFPTERVLSRTPLIIRTVDQTFPALSKTFPEPFKTFSLYDYKNTTTTITMKYKSSLEKSFLGIHLDFIVIVVFL